MTTVEAEQPRDAAQRAFARHAWREALERFAEADARSPLTPSDLEAYAEAAWWCGTPDDAIHLRERAYAGFLDAGDRRRAVKMAVLLSDDHAARRSLAVAMAWLQRAERLVGDDRDSVEYGYVRLHHAFIAMDTHDAAAATAAAREALALGERFRDRDLQALALAITGRVLIDTGDVREGMARMDEASVAAVSGELSLQITGIVYCITISACRDLGDYRRAGEWTEAAHRWCERQSVNGFPGVCRVHRAELMALRGALAKAEQEARQACEEIMRYEIPVVAEAFYEIGSIRLRMGDLPAAEEAFRQAHEAGQLPEPGLALIRLAEGKADAANAALRRALAEATARPMRARLLPAQVEVAIAAGDLDTARAAAAEMETIAVSFGTLALRAAAERARGAVSLAQGATAEALRQLRQALASWQELEAPYEAAQTRMLIAQACRASGDGDAASLELAAAKATFERIGARRDARLAAEELGTSDVAAPAGPRVRRTFLFTDIVGSTTLVAAIGDAAWQDLIRWHDDAMRRVIAEHGGEEIRHQGDGFVVAFAAPASAIDCAIAIQRRLAEHRRANGFAPAVRIGVHSAEATQRGLDYAGVGVHEAARVGALADGGEILVTRTTLEATGRELATGPARTVELKGIATPVEVLPVVWR
ncbi:MAG TPA: adenylate/guanylate cyclase domain-containing protein [Candidatus Limnocylindria bacterium]|nr:adenylate/guanylate cyclase domain-containing protein [Candidatus Limnocylindria bacterium]